MARRPIGRQVAAIEHAIDKMKRFILDVEILADHNTYAEEEIIALAHEVVQRTQFVMAIKAKNLKER